MGSLLKPLKNAILTVSQALVICHNQSLESKCDLSNVLVSIHAILFFGTPHAGLDGPSLLTTISRWVSVHKKSTDVVLKDLKAHSSELENIQSLYVAASEKISSIFFCEEYATFGIGNQGEPVGVVRCIGQLLIPP